MSELASYIEGHATGLLCVECSLQWSDISGHRPARGELVGLLACTVVAANHRNWRGGEGGRQKVSYISSFVT